MYFGVVDVTTETTVGAERNLVRASQFFSVPSEFSVSETLARDGRQLLP